MSPTATIESLEQISRARALTDAESIALERAIRKQRATARMTCVRFTNWSPQDDKRILKARKANKPAVEIAAMVGRTPWAIYVRLSRLGKMDGVNMRDARKRARAKEIEA